MKTLEPILFKDRKDYKDFLKNTLENLGEEYNVHLHIISLFGHDFRWRNCSPIEMLDQKTFGILNEGLRLDLHPVYRYSAMRGTTCYYGTNYKIDLNEVLDYVYDRANDPIKRVVIFAIPKYIEIDGQKVEYSSYKGACTPSRCTPEVKEDLENAYKTINHNINGNHHTKFSLFDCTLSEHMVIPKEYILGVQQYDTEKDEYSFLINENHVSLMEPETRMEFDDAKAEKILSLGYDPETDNRLDIFVKRTQADQDMLDRLLYDDV